MTFNSPDDSSSILEDGRIKPGVYKIQNLASRTYLDILEYTKETCCRPAEKLEEGGGLVRSFPYSFVRVSDDFKWEIKPPRGWILCAEGECQSTQSLPSCAEWCDA
jgi:hypothetical protein